MRIPRKVTGFINKYVKVLGLSRYKLRVALISDNLYMVDNKVVETEYLGEIVCEGNNYYVLILTEKALREDIEDTIIHELLHLFFWVFVERMKNIVDIMDIHIEKKTRLEDEIDDLEHAWIDKLAPIIRKYPL